ncbi:MAG: hypothetical protein LBK47_06040 [Prevotellaceae bacterium]|jgi:hypothetical protein|nr:hypothetical protein [Prevotellaceae bacterium]
MKKAIALSFLLLAGITVLAHAVIPHHHHNQIPVVVCGNHHEHKGTTPEHHHSGTYSISPCADPDGHCDGATEECSLAKAFVKSGADKPALQSLDVNVNLLTLPCIPAGYSMLQITDNGGLPFRQKPYLPSYHTEYVSVSLGLRAPPVC